MCGSVMGYTRVMDMGSGHSVCQHLNGSHVYGILVCLSSWLTGGLVVFPSPRFDPEASVRAVQTARNMHIPCAPSMADAFLDSFSALGDAPITSIRTLNVGGGIISDSLLQKVRANAPKRFIMGFGMSEGAVTLMNSVKEVDQYVMGEHTCVGPPIPGAAVRICAFNSRKILGRGEVGELHQGGSGVIAGYYDLGLDSDRFYEVNGTKFVMTGDQAYMDNDGRVFMVGRYKDLIVRHGENLDPVKIENYFSDAIGAIVQAVGIPDELGGESLVVVLERTSREALAVAELRQQSSLVLGAASVPSRFLDLSADLGLDSWPRTVNGKYRKDLLRKRIQEFFLHSSQRQDESESLEDQLCAIWSNLSGLPQHDISHDLSVFTFADSMMQIEFLSAVYHQLRRHVSLRELNTHYSIYSLAEVLRQKPLVVRKQGNRADGTQAVGTSPTLDTSNLAKQLTPGLKEAVRGRLDTLRMTAADVERLIPMSDYMSLMATQVRSKSWSYRHVVLLKNVTSQDAECIVWRWVTGHSLLRSTLVRCDRTHGYYLVFLPSQALRKQQVSIGPAVGTLEDLITSENGEAATSQGLLLKVIIVPLGDCTDSGLILHWHHSIFDGIVLKRWYGELAGMVAKAPSQMYFWPYRDFAFAYDDYRRAEESWTAARFHATRLAGISLTPQNFWPPQRAPLWLRGDDTGWIGSDGKPGNPAVRPLLDGSQSRGTAGMTFSVRVPRILELQRDYEIRASVVAKAACVLFNLRETSNGEAVFVSVESGRAWPGEAKGPAIRPAPALEIDGPTMTGVLNRITSPPDTDTVRTFLHRLQTDQREIDLHTHAPISHILGKLSDFSPTGAQDAKIARALINRQVFNWQPSAPGGSLKTSHQDASHPYMQFLDVLARTDLGIVWSPSLETPDTLCLEASWDDAQLYTHEVEVAMETFLCCAAWLADPAHLDWCVVKCVYSGYEIHHDRKPVDYRR
ncbi:hypothetical protein LTR10_021394 [Elasticomyces elasticus]|nr:hypothetical protein LTR10_021394 [Elasticomyces elasticus]KAK4971782.1 hypothetical protein LTR42_007510 [Elasticomyces elasticus]